MYKGSPEFMGKEEFNVEYEAFVEGISEFLSVSVTKATGTGNDESRIQQDSTEPSESHILFFVSHNLHNLKKEIVCVFH
jgi:hypothetical protein